MNAGNIFEDDSGPQKLEPPAPLGTPTSKPAASEPAEIPQPAAPAVPEKWGTSMVPPPIPPFPWAPGQPGPKAPILIIADKSFVRDNDEHLVYLKVIPEALMNVVAVESFQIDSITEDTGAPALIYKNWSYFNGRVHNLGELQLHVKTSPAAKSLQSIKGVATFLCSTEKKTLELKNLKTLKGHKVILGNVEFTFSYVQRDADFGIQVDTSCPAGTDPDSFKVYDHLARMEMPEVFDAKGTKLWLYSAVSSTKEGGSRNFHFFKSFPRTPAGDPVKFTWEIHTKAVRTQTSFDVMNVRLRQQAIPGPFIDTVSPQLPAQVTLRRLPTAADVPKGPLPTAISTRRRMNFHLKGVTAKAAFLELGLQTGLKFESDELDTWERIAMRSINADAENLQYWDAAIPIFLQARVMPVYVAENRVYVNILNAERTWDREPAAVSGPVRISTPVSFVIPKGAPAADLHFRTMIDPTRFALTWESLRVNSVTDDTGSAVVVVPPTAKKLHSAIRSGVGRWDVMLQPNPKAKRITSLKGVAGYLLREDAQVLRIDHLANCHGLQVPIDGMDFEFDETPTLEGCAIEVVIRPGTRSVSDFKILAYETNFISPVVTDMTGHSFKYQSRNSSQITDDGIRIKMGFRRPAPTEGRPVDHANAVGPAATFWWAIPTSLSRYEAPFEIKNVPIQFKN